MPPKICCIIPTHGAGDAFIECIDSLLKQTRMPSQIIIVDNNTKDGSVERVKLKVQTDQSITTQFSWISLEKNSGVTGGRNAGIDALPTQYDYALFVDHDMVAQENMIEELLKTMERNKSTGIVTPKIYYWENKKIIWSAGTDINVKTGQTVFYGGQDNGQYNFEREVAVAPAIFLVKKSVLDAIRCFDERYFATYEDTDFCFSAKKGGFLTYYSPLAIAYHKIPYDPEMAMNRLIERSYWVGRNRYLFLRKFHLFSFVSLVYIPVYVLYYTYLGLRYTNLKSILNYYKGLIEGLTIHI
jgi:GT2 family glycosyltransferase